MDGVVVVVIHFKKRAGRSEYYFWTLLIFELHRALKTLVAFVPSFLLGFESRLRHIAGKQTLNLHNYCYYFSTLGNEVT